MHNCYCWVKTTTTKNNCTYSALLTYQTLQPAASSGDWCKQYAVVAFPERNSYEYPSRSKTYNTQDPKGDHEVPRCPEAVSREEVILEVGREMMGEVLYKGDWEGSWWTTVKEAQHVGRS